MAEKNTSSAYIGKVKNAGTQKIEAPHLSRDKGKGATVKTGNDLRTGK